jgi:hypothetical protein
MGRLARRLTAIVGITSALAASSGLGATPQHRTASGPALSAKESAPAAAPKPEALAASDKAAIAERWGIRIESLRLTAAGYMLDFRYHVIDAEKAAPLFVRKTRPMLTDEATGVVVAVPVPPKTGSLRSSNHPKQGRTYFMFFANPGTFIGKHRKVTVTIGEFSVRGITVR